MGFSEELAAGIELVRKEIERQKILKISETFKYKDRRAHYFLISSGAKQVDFVLTEEFLTDLSATKEYKTFLEEYAQLLEHRFHQHDPMDFYCRSGTAFKLEIYWPFNAYAGRAASYILVTVADLRTPTLVAKCAVLFGMDGSYGPQNPFDRQRTIVNSIRQAIDQQSVTFYGTAAHPDQYQQIEVWSTAGQVIAPRSEVEQFISGKVYWLGFRRGGRDAKVWIADPWDAQYLGVDTAALQRAAQVQDARDILRVDSEDFATAGKGMLIESSQFESEPTSQLALFGGDSKKLQGIRDLLTKLLPSTVSIVMSGEQPIAAISSSIRSLIERSDFVVFDVNSDNPNTFFEIGFAQALKKKVLLLVPKDYAPSLPYQIASFLYLAYDPRDLGSLEDSLANYIQRYWGLLVKRFRDGRN
jgi:hypothetical protein